MEIYFGSRSSCHNDKISLKAESVVPTEHVLISLDQFFMEILLELKGQA